MKFAKYFLLNCCLMAMAGLWGCSSSCFNIKVLMPAYTDMGKYQNLIIDFHSPSSGSDANHSFEAWDMFAGTILNSGRFKVIDRQSLYNFIDESSLNPYRTGKGDPSTLSKLAGKTAFIFGRISNDIPNETFFESDPSIDRNNTKFRDTAWTVVKTRKVIYSLSINFRIVDAETSQIITMQTLSATDEASNQITVDMRKSKYSRPDPINVENLFNNCLHKIFDQFSKYILPFYINENVCFQSDDLLPEVKDARTLFLHDRWEDGIEALKNMTMKKGLNNVVMAKAYYNLGLMQMYELEFAKAEGNFNTARGLDPANTLYMDVFKELKRKKAIDEKLKEQGD